MTSINELCLGQPRFPDGGGAALAAKHGALAAWQLALTQKGPAVAAAGVSGPFAIGLRESSGRAYLAVDRFAMCTLCYRVVDGQLTFSERADQLVERGDELDRQAIFDYLYFHAIPSPRSIFHGVHRVPPGHYVLFEDGRLTVAPYWVPEFHEPSGKPCFASLRDEFRSLLRVAVSDQLDTGKHACFLSGGTDSSTVAGMIREATGQAAATYSIGFEADGYDEMAYARVAARAFGTEHHEYYVTPEDLVKSIPTVAGFYDQPFGNSSALPAYYCARMARDDGVTRILAGDGGDELFGGNSRYAKQRVFGWYGMLPAPLRRGLMGPFFERPSVARMPVLKKGSSYIEQAKMPMPDRLQMYNLLLRLGIENVLSRDFLAQVDVQAPAAQQRAVWKSPIAQSDINRTLAFDWRYTLGESDLPKVRGTTQLAGIAVGYPMLDERLLEFSMRLPTDYKLKNLKLRWFFKEALRGFLPDEILTKKKQGFGLPFGVWLTRHGALKKLAIDSLASLSTRGIVRPEFITELVDKRLAEHPAYYGEMVWIMMMLEQWLQQHSPGFRS
ncbi:MAG: asparagine synthase [Ramlibacter sp.]|nr:asparagine synthase [Ramlibacter sp.]